MNPLPSPPRVYISHAREEVALRDDALDLANRLRREGVEAWIDLYEPSPAEGWELWRERQLLAADLVVIVCTGNYRRCFEARDGSGGLEVRWEAGLVRRRLHDDPSFGARVLPVVLGNSSTDVVPTVLRSHTCYSLPEGYDDLYRRITGQPALVRPPLGTLVRSIHNLGPRPWAFEGRDAELAALAQAARNEACTVLTGMGGVGKTRLALEHAHRCERDYDVRWWVRAYDAASLRADLVQLGVELGIVSEPERVDAATRGVLQWLSTHDRWLLVLDDAERPAAIFDLLHTPPRGHVLVTSRARTWRAFSQVIELRPLCSPASRAVLVQRSGRRDDAPTDADAIADALGHLPLALVQAGAYIEATGCSFRDYLDHFEQRGLALLDDPKSMADSDRRTVAATWELSLAEIRARRPAAAALLDWLAFLDPAGVPLRLLLEHPEGLPPPLDGCARSPIDLDDLIAVLLEFGMIERDRGTLRVHGLVQAVTREKLAADVRSQVALAVVRWTSTVFGYTEGRSLVRDVPIGSAEQVMAMSRLDACVQADSDLMIQVLLNVGDFQLVRGATGAALAAFQRALTLLEALATTWSRRREHARDLSIVLNRIGSIEVKIGNLAAARDHFARALELRKALADAEPLSPTTQDDLASSLIRLGDLALLSDDVEAARELFAEAVELRDAAAEPGLADASTWRSLARCLRKLAKAEARLHHPREAKQLLRRAAAIAETLVLMEPASAGARRDLSLVLGDLGDLLGREREHESARDHLGRALAITEALAAEDPDDARARRDLCFCLDRWGLIEQHAGRLEQARTSMERALALRRTLMQADPADALARQDVLRSLCKLEDLERFVGDCTKANEHAWEAAQLGASLRSESREDARTSAAFTAERHPHRAFSPSLTATARCGLTRRDRFEERKPIATILQRHRRDNLHADELEDLGRSLLRSGHVQTARRAFAAQVAFTKALTEAAPQSMPTKLRLAGALYNLGKVERKLQELAAAHDHFSHAAKIFESVLETAPGDRRVQRDLGVCLGKLGALSMERGDIDEARERLRRCSTIFEWLAADDPGDIAPLRDLGISLGKLGIAEDSAGDLAAARDLFQRHLDIASMIVELDPTSVHARQCVFQALRRLADVEIRLGHHVVARELFQRLLDEEDVLARAAPEVAFAALDLVLLHADPTTLPPSPW